MKIKHYRWHIFFNKHLENNLNYYQKLFFENCFQKHFQTNPKVI